METSLRGKLIEEILRVYAENLIFSETDTNIDNEMEAELEKHLSFTTLVNIMKNEKDLLHATIDYEDEGGNKRVMDFYITKAKQE